MATQLFQKMQFRISQEDIVTTPTPVYSDVGCVTGYSLDGSSKAEIDTTCNTSDAKEFKFGLKDNGTLSLDINYDPEGSGETLLTAAYADDEAYSFQIEYNNSAGVSGTTKTFNGYVMSVSESGSIDDKLTGSVEIRISGEIVKASPVAS